MGVMGHDDDDDDDCAVSYDMLLLRHYSSI